MEARLFEKVDLYTPQVFFVEPILYFDGLAAKYRKQRVGYFEIDAEFL